MTAVPVRAVLLGCGMVAEKYATTLASAPGIEGVACADLYSERAAAFATRHRLTALPAAQLLDPALTDLAVILTPPHTHATVVSDAIAARIRAIWCESPIALDPADADHVVSEAATVSTLLAVAPDTGAGPGSANRRARPVRGHRRIPAVRHRHPVQYRTGALAPSARALLRPRCRPARRRKPLLPLRTRPALRAPARPLRHRPDPTRSHHPLRASHRQAPQGPGLHASRGPAGGRDQRHPHHTHRELRRGSHPDPYIEIQGTAGTLLLPHPNFHEGDVQFIPSGERAWRTLPQPQRTHHPRAAPG
ncbi:Gfo/Idh/MocA family protein [Streptomyces goshikiensis]|uniref:Gfo/Idh/MocA family protein n=1 Tax=Streptomyces goshikiensis TaxID=1942 RepID=UPI0036CF29AD